MHGHLHCATCTGPPTWPPGAPGPSGRLWPVACPPTRMGTQQQAQTGHTHAHRHSIHCPTGGDTSKPKRIPPCSMFQPSHQHVSSSNPGRILHNVARPDQPTCGTTTATLRHNHQRPSTAAAKKHPVHQTCRGHGASGEPQPLFLFTHHSRHWPTAH